MPRIDYIEGKIYEVEGFDVTIRRLDGSDVYSNLVMPVSYRYARAAQDSWTVSEWKEKRFKKTFPGFDVDVLMGDGTTVANGNMKLSNVRDSYPSED